VTGSNLQDRVRALCVQVTTANTEAEISALPPQLQAAIRDHIDYLRAVATELIPEAFRRLDDTRD
jgi:membrane protein YdbS with pleckstrin-like domain